jgi:hypothetical protein
MSQTSISSTSTESIALPARSWLTQAGVVDAITSARESGDWSSLAQAKWANVTGYNTTTRAVTGKAGRWYDTLEVSGLVSSAEVAAIRQQTRRSGTLAGAAKNASYSVEEIQTWVKETLQPCIHSCRIARNWEPLFAKNWEGSPYFKPFYSRLGNSKYWYDGLLGAGLISEKEREEIGGAARSGSGEAISTKRLRHSITELKKWISESLTGLVSKARDTSDYSCLTRSKVNEDPIADFAMRLVGKTSSWETFLRNETDLTEDEHAKIKATSSSSASKKIALARLKFTPQQVEEKFAEEVASVLRTARASGNWDTLLVNRWTKRPWFSSASSHFGKRDADWFGVLKSLGGLTPGEEQAIRTAGKARIIEGASKPRRDSSRANQDLSRKIRVIEQMAMGDERAQLPNFGEVAQLLARQSVSLEVSTTVEPRRMSFVLETLKGSQPLLTELEKYRLELGITRSSVGWDDLHSRFEAIERGISGYLTNRIGLLHLAHLANSGVVVWPQRVLSACSGNGSLYTALNELAAILSGTWSISR